MSLFVTSDTHYAHKNICRGVSQWAEGGDGGSHQSTRDFKTVEAMNSAIVDGINSKVGQDDTLLHVGDWCFGGIENIWKFRSQIVCKNIHLIFGNHDHHIENNRILPNVFRNVNLNLLSKEGTDYKGNQYPVYARDLFNSVAYVREFNIGNKQTVFLSHYAHRVWDKSHHGRIHLYGHSHASLEEQEWGKSMDVGIDNYYRLYGEYKPFSIEQILKIMDKRPAKIIDHHNAKTN